MVIKSFCGLLILLFVTSSPVWAQQFLSTVQQCSNHQQELVLSDITFQELRARCGNIMRQAYELETENKKLKEEIVKLTDEVEKIKKVQDASKPAD